MVGAAVAGLTAILVERMAYRPLRRRGTTNRLVPLVTAIGVSFFLQDLVRLIEGLWHNEFFLRMRTIPDYRAPSPSSGAPSSSRPSR